MTRGKSPKNLLEQEIDPTPRFTLKCSFLHEDLAVLRHPMEKIVEEMILDRFESSPPLETNGEGGLGSRVWGERGSTGEPELEFSIVRGREWLGERE